ncbi:MAG: C40 family peptidase [Agathobacter sp.]|nr:C40 family peptidase [Agathobacter sp.]
MNFLSRYGKWGKRVVSAALVASMALSMPVLSELGQEGTFGSAKAYASSYSEQKQEALDKKNQAQEEQDKAQQDLDKTNQEMQNIQNEQEQLSAEIQTAQKQLRSLLAEQEELKVAMDDTQARIDQANIDLEEAKETEAQGYESMKLRIQYMYENSADSSIWTAIIESNGIADMLNRIEYMNNIHQTDRNLMKQYAEAVEAVEQLTIALQEEMDNLRDQMEEYQAKQEKVEVLIADLETKQDKNEVLLTTAKAKAKEYEETISEQGRIIQQQEARAAQLALLEEEEARKKLEEQQKNQNSGSSSGSSGSSSSYDGGGAGSSGLGSASYLTDPDADPAFTSNVSGTELVNYALQFVGNPYVWGGNSLTNGVDCSGFVHEIYEHFGFDLPRYSQSFKTVGQPVSLQNIKAGDIVVYPGHVAIYIGNGCIVEAQSTKAGITSNRSVQCHTITAIRRVL